MKKISIVKKIIFYVLHVICSTTAHAIEKTLIELEQLYTFAATQNYSGELVSQQEHALQTAWHAQQSLYEHTTDDEFVIAAFLHDIGHLLSNNDLMGKFGTRHHEQLGAQWLNEHGFSEKVVSLVREHVNAKRYLTHVNPDYYQRLSTASKETLLYQGGSMSEDEARSFEQLPHFSQILALRTCDEQGKVPGSSSSTTLETMMAMIQKHLVKQSLL